MKYKRLPAFTRDFAALPPEHQHTFRDVVRKHFLPAVDAGSFTGTPPWPRRLRVHQLVGTHVYSITWSFRGPDGRATFHLETGDDETVLETHRHPHHLHRPVDSNPTGQIVFRSVGNCFWSFWGWRNRQRWLRGRAAIAPETPQDS